jgi:hypothetical protein
MISNMKNRAVTGRSTNVKSRSGFFLILVLAGAVTEVLATDGSPLSANLLRFTGGYPPFAGSRTPGQIKLAVSAGNWPGSEFGCDRQTFKQQGTIKKTMQ